MKTVYYFPLEPYIERYTWFLSSEEGWFETSARNAGHEVRRVVPEGDTAREIRAGQVLDVTGRSRWAMAQVDAFLRLIEQGEVKDGDCLYVEDFWHPGIEAIFYAKQFLKLDIRIGTFIHAQSIDDSDFMWAARHWARDIEIGFSKGYDCVFTTSPLLQDLAIEAGYKKNLHVTGLPFNSKRLSEQLLAMGYDRPLGHERKGVIFTSRFDAEKNPHDFMDLAEQFRNNNDVPFILVKPRPIDKMSNCKAVVARLKKLSAEGIIQLVDTSEKEGGRGKIAYYDALHRAKVQFNCADQDWTSWTLIEACWAGCTPLYPMHKDFPRELNQDSRFLYPKGNMVAAHARLRDLLTQPQPDLSYVVHRHDDSTRKALQILTMQTGEG